MLATKQVAENQLLSRFDLLRAGLSRHLNYPKAGRGRKVDLGGGMVPSARNQRAVVCKYRDLGYPLQDGQGQIA